MQATSKILADSLFGNGPTEYNNIFWIVAKYIYKLWVGTGRGGECVKHRIANIREDVPAPNMAGRLADNNNTRPGPVITGARNEPSRRFRNHRRRRPTMLGFL